MFESAESYAVLPASDLDRAKRWWKDVFDIDPIDDSTGGVMLSIAGTSVLVYETQFAGTAQNTAFGIDTDDLDRDMAALRERGIVFNEYDLPGVTTQNGVVEDGGMRTAWFDDSEGNIIALGQRVPG
ncbi:VOC family protein [Agromyces subbeticus]|uniref:VOC family protein n=1 Tax=Agromyces subbeticus TaxID=293890 RepID=UPI0003B4FCFA|nr:VOC family protein [Agromyces subbeticus]